jgi:hypothetical protein
MTDDRTHDEQQPGGVAGPTDEATTLRYPGSGNLDPAAGSAPADQDADAAWYSAAPDTIAAPTAPPTPDSYSAPDTIAAPTAPPTPPTPPTPADTSPAAPSGLAAIGFAAVSSLRRHRRQTITFAAVLALVLVLGAGAFAVFKGTIAWPFGGGPTPAAVCPTPTPTVQAAGLTRVRVYNATSRRGFALSVARDLQKRGFKVPTVGNDPQESKPTAAVIRHGPNGVLAAHTLGTQLIGKVVYQQDDRVGEMVDLVLGPGFAMVDAKKGAAALKATPAHGPGCPASV